MTYNTYTFVVDEVYRNLLWFYVAMTLFSKMSLIDLILVNSAKEYSEATLKKCLTYVPLWAIAIIWGLCYSVPGTLSFIVFISIASIAGALLTSILQHVITQIPKIDWAQTAKKQ